MQVGFPNYTARFGVKRDDETARGGHVQFTVVIDGSGFKARIATEVVDGFAGVVSPGDFEAGNVRRRDWINLRTNEEGNAEEDDGDSHGLIVEEAGWIVKARGTKPVNSGTARCALAVETQDRLIGSCPIEAGSSWESRVDEPGKMGHDIREVVAGSFRP